MSHVATLGAVATAREKARRTGWQQADQSGKACKFSALTSTQGCAEQEN